eukprot:3709298-Amphidinium_carterae.2
MPPGFGTQIAHLCTLVDDHLALPASGMLHISTTAELRCPATVCGLCSVVPQCRRAYLCSTLWCVRIRQCLDQGSHR